VSYTHAGGIDRPLVITKDGVRILPHQNWRGQFSSGTYADGTRSDCAPGVTTGCIAVRWPGYRTTAWHHDVTEPDIRTWWGGLVDGMRDVSGQQYKRNRYYDPATGQFTQPDPIGIAGGLNTYGFAAGDPVTYSDPYGLAACPTAPEGDPRRNNPSWSDCTAEELRLAQGAVDEPLFADPLNLLPVGRISKGLGWLRGTVGNGISRLIGRGASEAGEHLVLGLASHGLERTAAAVGGRHLMNDASWRTTFIAALGDTRTTFTVSLDGLSGSSTYQKVMGAAQQAGQGATNWEMAQLYQAGRLGSVNFVQTVNGKVTNVANPFQR
jgi:RHS repeat-associated protein